MQSFSKNIVRLIAFVITISLITSGALATGSINGIYKVERRSQILDMSEDEMAAHIQNTIEALSAMDASIRSELIHDLKESNATLRSGIAVQKKKLATLEEKCQEVGCSEGDVHQLLVGLAGFSVSGTASLSILGDALSLNAKTMKVSEKTSSIAKLFVKYPRSFYAVILSVTTLATAYFIDQMDRVGTNSAALVSMNEVKSEIVKLETFLSIRINILNQIERHFELN